ncbi:MAG: AAA family ATPase [Anaerolineae bacterium]
MSKPIKSISISGFKSIRDLQSFRLDSINILIGANGAGKSNFISFFSLLNQIILRNLQLTVGKLGGADTLLYFGRKVTEEISGYLEFGDNMYKFTLVPTEDDTLIFSSEEIAFWNPVAYSQPHWVPLGSGHKETKLYEESAKTHINTIADYVIGSISSWKIYHFHDTSPSAKMKLKGDINDNRVFLSDAANLAAFLYDLKLHKIQFYSKILSTVQLVAPYIKDFLLQPDTHNTAKIQLQWLESGNDSVLGASYLSDGTLRFLCLATLLLQPKLPSTVIIDEPELGLHPYAITILASLINKASVITQIIISTQSVQLVNQFSPENVIVVDRDNEQSVFKRLTNNDLETWLEGYGMGDLWAKNIIGGYPR